MLMWIGGGLAAWWLLRGRRASAGGSSSTSTAPREARSTLEVGAEVPGDRDTVSPVDEGGL